MNHFKSCFLILFTVLGQIVCAQVQPVLRLAVLSGDFERNNSPVSISLEGKGLQADIHYQLLELGSKEEIPVSCQIDHNQLFWILSGKTPPGSSRFFELRESMIAPTENPGEIKVRKEDGTILFQQFGRNILQYQFEELKEPTGTSVLYRRAGFIHPLWSPKGEVLTRIQAPDHYHHMGIWNPWTSASFEGREIDFWNLYKGEGTVKVPMPPVYHTGRVFGEFSSRHSHIDLTAPDPSGAKTALEEEWQIRIWNSGSEDAPRLIDFRSTLYCATDSIFKINAYRYQGFSIRATKRWNDETANLLTSENYNKSNGNGTRARWCDMNGVSEYGRSGILIMTNPQNHNFPEQLRIWPTGMNDGKENVFLNFNPAQEQDWLLYPGKAYSLYYRMMVYDGRLDKESMEKYWQDYTNPPEVKILLNTLIQDGKRVLVYTKNGEGYVHDNISKTVEVLTRIGKEEGIIVDVTDDPELITEENLQKYQALIFSNTNNETFETDEQRHAFQRYMQAGGGLVGIHSASGSERNWPWFSQLLGGKFRRHPPLQQFDVRIVDRLHPSTMHLPDIWKWEDECYYLDHLNPDARILLAANLNTIEDDKKGEYPGVIFGNLFPLSWCRETELGRVWYTALGHKKEYYDMTDFLSHLKGGIIWVLEGSKGLDYSRAGEVLIMDSNQKNER